MTKSHLTTHERFQRMFAHQEADRIPVIDSPWSATVERWHSEGMPNDVDFIDFFELDHVSSISVDSSPRYPVQTLEQTPEYRVHTTSWGATLKDWKHAGGVPQFLDFTIRDPDSWRGAKARMIPRKDRIDWTYLNTNYPVWRKRGDWIFGNLWFGFDVAHSWTVGTERVLLAIIEQPEWLMDVFSTMLDVNLALLDMVWDAGFTFDAITWCDDMGYKHNQFFSVRTYRNLLKPIHQRAVDWAHRKGIKAHLHSCGDIRPLVPELIDIGVDALNPLEVKAGMDPIDLKQRYGKQLVLHGGINAVLYDDIDALEEEMRRVIPIVKADGGYIFSSDHSVPSSVSLDQFKRIIHLAKELGTYS